MDDRPLKILLVEDNPGDARLIREMLSESSAARFELTHKKYLEEALKCMGEVSFDIVLLDLSLPDSRGLETVVRTLSSAPTLPIIVLAGLDDDTLGIQAVEKGAQDYLIKGHLNERLLVRVIMYALERKHAEEKLSRAYHELEQKVAERTLELTRANEQLKREIEERKQAKDKLKESAQTLSGILHSISDCMSMIDKDNTIIWANEVAKALFGPDIIGKKCFSCYQGRKQTCDFCQVMKTFKDGQDHHQETQVVDRYGNNRIFHCVSSVVNYDENGKPKLVMDVAHDITQIKKSENELHQLRAELLHATRTGTMVELTAALAHELNHPLGSILNNANAAKRFLKSKKPDLDEIRDIIADIISEDRRASDIMQKLRALMKKTEVEFSPLKINDIMEEVLNLMHSEIVIKNVSLSKHMAKKLPKVNGERIQLQQVFLNLIINAIDAMQKSKVKNLHISIAKHDAKSIIVCVRDTGVGFDEKNKGSLFKPFFTTKKEGLGMGLSVNKSIVTSHGGDIWVENNKEGGAGFFITLPVYKEQSS